MTAPRDMIATYRLQLTPAFGFADAERVVPYLARLGVSHLYLSPVTDARRGSTHGYDVVDHGTIREELGGEEGFESLRKAARAAGLGLVLDIVPNHAGVGPRNARWQDLLAHGKASPFARFFDVDWKPLKRELEGKVLVPVLGKSYGEALQDGELSVIELDEKLYAAYFHHRFALDPATWPKRIDFSKLTGDELHALLEKQHFRLAFWKTAGSEVNYRRFFSINELVALRQEDPEVFEETHRLVADLVKRDGVDGVRVDHVDGLADPEGYLRRLQELLPDTREGRPPVWVEKIVAAGERLPASWPVEGTTGYEFAGETRGVLTWPAGERPIDRMLRRHVPASRAWEEEVHRGKRLVMRTDLSGELRRLAVGLDRMSEADYRTRDFTREALGEALAEVIAAFPRYRTYLPRDPDEGGRVVRQAIDRALERNRGLEPSVFYYIARVLLGGIAPSLEDERTRWVARFQQYTAPVCAKGVEDTAFYRWCRLAAHNEVGDEPDRWSLDAATFHAGAAARAATFPRNLLATATHDTKRGEDLRMRLLVLAELPAEWRRTARKLQRIAAAHRTPEGPGDADAYLFFQTLAALWSESDEAAPRSVFADRLVEYTRKAAREAKQHTGWIAPDEGYEATLEGFVRGFLADPALPAAIGPLAKQLAQFGFANGLSQLVLKLTSPGVPDLYQGCEHLDLSLVDPDNRRPVDYDARRAELDALAASIEAPDAARVEALLARHDDRAKLYVTAALLRFRRAHAEAFAPGATYEPLQAEGPAAEHVIAYARGAASVRIVVSIPRYPARLAATGGMRGTRLNLGKPAKEILTGVRVGEIADLTARPAVFLLDP